MERFQALLTPDQLSQLRDLSEEKGTPVAQLLREALDQYLVMGEVPFEDLDKLARRAGVYIVFTKDELLYVGRSKDIHVRWRNHHKRNEIANYSDVVVLWMATEPGDLQEVEALLIDRLSPALNIMNPANKAHGKTRPMRIYQETKELAEEIAKKLNIPVIEVYHRAAVSYNQRLIEAGYLPEK